MDYTKHSTGGTSAARKARSDQIKAAGGGYVFAVTPMSQFRRFLVLGTEGNTMYASERDRTQDNVQSLQRLLNDDKGVQAVNAIVDISDAGRAPKQDPAIFALAYAARHGDDTVKSAAYRALPLVCRTGTHLFQWVANMKKMGSTLGSGGARRAIAKWYLEKEPHKLALQLVKYRQRDGWSHRDVLLLAHVKPPQSELMAKLLAYPKKGDELRFSVEESRLLYGAQKLAKTKTATEAAKLIRDYKLPREVVPTEFLNDLAVWEALLQDMPMHATVRNLGKMTSIGLLSDLSDAAKLVRDRLENQEQILRSRMHPFAVFVALETYRQGRGFKGSLTWSPNSMLCGALDGAFYLAFGNVKPTGKNMLLALDVSGSMTWGEIAGVPFITPNKAAAAMAMITARTEKNAIVRGFADSFRDLKITASDTIESAVEKTRRMSFGATDCSLPMVWALREKARVDGFVVYTDNENNTGRVQPFEALQNYRQRMGREARLVVVGMTATNASIADQADAGALDVVGFDTATPSLISDFVAGQL